MLEIIYKSPIALIKPTKNQLKKERSMKKSYGSGLLDPVEVFGYCFIRRSDVVRNVASVTGR